MTTPTDDYVHQALVSDGAPPRPWCGGVGRSVMRKAEVTCPDCLQLDADRKARTEVHDAHAIPAADEPDHLAAFRAQNPKPGEIWLDGRLQPLLVNEGPDGWYLTTLLGFDQFRPSAVGTIGPMTRARIVPADALVLPWQNPILIDNDGDHWQVVAWHADGGLTMPISRVRRDYGPLTVAGAEQPEPAPIHDSHAILTADELSDWERELLAAKDGPVVAVEWPEPAKTHDLSVRREHGNVVVTAEAATGNCQVYLQDGVALDLGRVLAVLTPAQRQLLVDDLTGGGQ